MISEEFDIVLQKVSPLFTEAILFCLQIFHKLVKN